jgi:hypothetical protein
LKLLDYPSYFELLKIPMPDGKTLYWKRWPEIGTSPTLRNPVREETERIATLRRKAIRSKSRATISKCIREALDEGE